MTRTGLSMRVLPPSEWSRLAGTDVGTITDGLNPDNTRIVVVEEDGAIVATWAMLHVVHAECVWIAPSHRSRFGVVARLLRGMRAIAAEWSVDRVITGSVSAHVTDLIRRLGGTPMPCESFILPVDTDAARRRPVEGSCL